MSAYHVELLPPGLAYPIFRSEPKERFEQLLARDERNVSITEYLTDSLSAIDPDLEEALTMEGGLLDVDGREELTAAFRAGEGNSQIAQRLAERYSGAADIVELEGGDLADYQGTQAGFELAIQDKYETTISRSWGRASLLTNPKQRSRLKQQNLRRWNWLKQNHLNQKPRPMNLLHLTSRQ